MLKFIDLFAGLGGFHLALGQLGHQCVFGCELNDTLRQTYLDNFGLTLEGDIRKIDIKKIPDFDVLCAGFPCQPFSKAGKQEGIEDLDRGNLFFNILTLLQYRRPQFFILENVPNLARHDQSKTWSRMKKKLKALGYQVDSKEYSPHQFGIPQHRHRFYIVGSLRNGLVDGLENFRWPDDESIPTPTSVLSILEQNASKAKKLDQSQVKALDVWQEFLSVLEPGEPLGFPIWAYEFRADYPYEKFTPFSTQDLSAYHGSFGLPLRGQKFDSPLLPSYARLKQDAFPGWKQLYIRHNRNLYQKYAGKLDPIVDKIAAIPVHSWQKLEWNCQSEEKNIWNKIIQFRASGIRIKKADWMPSLVCTVTQIPIVGWEKRYITTREALRVQSFPDEFKLPAGNAAYQALGNAVNVHIINLIARRLLTEPTILALVPCQSDIATVSY